MKRFDLLNNIEKKYSLDDLEGYVLGYIFLRKINFKDGIEDQFQINFAIHTIKLCKKEDFYKIFHSVPTLENPTPKLVAVPKSTEDINPKLKLRYIKVGEEMYSIQLRKIEPYETILYALTDLDYLRKNLDLFTEYETFSRFKPEIQDKIKSFINNEKKTNITFFQHSKDGVYPLITKDIVNEINNFIYPELDLDKLIDKISEKSEKIYEDFLEETEKFMNSVPSEIDLMTETKILSVKMVKNIHTFLHNISKIREIRGNLINNLFRIQDQLKITSYIFLLLKTDFGKMFLDFNSKFTKVVKDKEKELIMELYDLQKNGVEVDWLIDILY